ncbi:Akirin-2 [Willisornis vidua]|uniref:Akirin-2 n=1 Tax=Willisornis vidua TaxID=1566151 RepID=A0ABQ9DH18_9PASS|nr:Akirin-2 [Willisornis vidua]
MACGATLKRTLDFDPLLSPASPKRRRCAPLSASAASSSFAAAASSPQKYLRMEPSPFGEVSSRLTTGTSSAASSPLKKEQPLFTLRQVGMICERLLKEREEKIREEYEEILTTKLAEQYDAFVKFTHDQIMRRYGEQPASCGTFAVYE